MSVSGGRRGEGKSKAYLCGSLDVLQVAGDEAGLLLLIVRHCDMCRCDWFGCKVLLCACFCSDV
jgi:hypothetical protein